MKNNPFARLATGQNFLDLGDELVIDNFAGGGGASHGIEIGIGRPVDIAINHDPEAIAQHKINHPHTKHYCENVWDVDPREVTKGRPVGLAWFSPDCKHFSKAKGGTPVKKNIRGLAWVAVRWAAAVRPRVIMLENVEEFKTWGPLTKDNKPCPLGKGKIFRKWIRQLENMGYQVEHDELRACNYGAPTIRKRFFLIARCDGKPIEWPEPTHGDGLLPQHSAAECIDWSIPCPSIFTRKKPLAENTMRRIAKGLQKFVIDEPDPFIIKFNGKSDAHAVDTPLHTVTAGASKLGLVTPYITRIGQTGFGGDRMSYSAEKPLTTITSKAEHLLIAPHIVKHFGGAIGASITRPLPTVLSRNTQNQLVTSHLLKLRNNCYGESLNKPVPTITAGGLHLGEVRAFLVKYYGTAIGQDVNEPLHSVTSKSRFGLITIRGEDYVIADIGMRMLSPRELYRAQSFPESYIIDLEYNGKPLTKTAQVRMCGNSVPPVLATALVRANFSYKSQQIAA